MQRERAAGEGRYVVFLNNDTIVLPGWLDELIAPFAADPAVGMTGSKLINGDGTLQEAGGILWNDGSAWNYGRGSNARLPHFSYSKDVDYISGASIAFPKTLWDELGGFDPLTRRPITRIRTSRSGSVPPATGPGSRRIRS